MPKKWWLRLCLIILMGLLSASSTAESPPVYLYILSFDNLSQNPEIDWLKEGFVDFLINHYQNQPQVEAQPTDKLDEVLNRLEQEPALKAYPNYILAGGFERSAGKFKIYLQFTDIRDWKKVIEDSVVIGQSDLAEVIQSLNTKVDQLLLGKQRGPVSTPEEPAAGPPSLSTEETQQLQSELHQTKADLHKVSRATLDISQAVEKFEKLLHTEKKPDQSVSASLFTRRKPLKQAELFTDKIQNYIEHTESFQNLLETIAALSYQIEIDDPFIARIPMQPKQVSLSFNVHYALDHDLISGWLASVPCQKTVQDNFIEYAFNEHQFIFSEAFLHQIARGRYRYFPVIVFQSDQGTVYYTIIDVPFDCQPISEQVKTYQRFTPLVNLTSGAWHVKLYLSRHSSEYQYELKVPVDILKNINNIYVEMMTETDIISQFVQ